MLVGMGLYSTDTPGTGGSIKEKREDFAVNEVLAEKTLSRIAENTGYAVYKLDKNGIDTNHALAEVQKRTGVRLKALGLKDSRAVTSQYVCATYEDTDIASISADYRLVGSIRHGFIHKNQNLDSLVFFNCKCVFTIL